LCCRSTQSSSSIWVRVSSRVLLWGSLLLFGRAEVIADGGRWFERETDSLTLIVPVADSAGARALLDTLVVLQADVARQLGDIPIPKTKVYVVRSVRDFDTLTHHRIPHWGAGVAYPKARTIVLNHRPGQTESLLKTARHEFSHILLHHGTRESDVRIPVWFNEGLAMWVAREWRLQQSFDVTAAALQNGLVPLREIDAVLGFGATRAQLAYDQSYLAIVFILSLEGEGVVPDLVMDLREGVDFDVAVYRRTGLVSEAFEAAYATFVEDRFGLRALLTSEEALWLYIVGLLCLVWLGVRVRNRQTLARWEESDPLDGLPLRLRAKIQRERER